MEDQDLMKIMLQVDEDGNGIAGILNENYSIKYSNVPTPSLRRNRLGGIRNGHGPLAVADAQFV